MTAPYRTRAFGAPVAPFHVVIIGGGIGGLTLAQGLKQAGISVAVYERDPTPQAGCRATAWHINPAGSPRCTPACRRTCLRRSSRPAADRAAPSIS